MGRVAIGLIALVISVILGYYGLPIVYRYAPSYGSIAIIILCIPLLIAIACLGRPIREFVEDWL